MIFRISIGPRPGSALPHGGKSRTTPSSSRRGRSEMPVGKHESATRVLTGPRRLTREASRAEVPVFRKSKSIVGLDLGNQAVKAVEIPLEGGGARGHGLCAR